MSTQDSLRERLERAIEIPQQNWVGTFNDGRHAENARLAPILAALIDIAIAAEKDWLVMGHGPDGKRIATLESALAEVSRVGGGS